MIKELYEAIITGDLERVKELIENGADVNYKDEHGKTPLIYAAQYGYKGKGIEIGRAHV